MSEEVVNRIRELAMGSRWTVADLNMAWRHMREIPDVSLDRFFLFTIDCQSLSVDDIVVVCQAVQKAVTGQVMIRTNIGGRWDM